MEGNGHPGPEPLTLTAIQVILILNEGETAKRWYDETENPTPYQGG